MEDQEAVNLAADWADISQGLRKDLGHQLHSQWIRPIQVGGIDKDTGTLDLFLPTEFSANWVKDRFADRLSLAWKIARSEVRDVRIQVHPGRRQVADLRLHADGRRPANDGADTSMMAIGADTLGDEAFEGGSERPERRIGERARGEVEQCERRVGIERLGKRADEWISPVMIL